jgi:vacuolar-type H+-ATPase subunit H
MLIYHTGKRPEGFRDSKNKIIEIKVGRNDLKPDEYKELKGNDIFKTLVADGTFIVDGLPDEEVDPARQEKAQKILDEAQDKADMAVLEAEDKAEGIVKDANTKADGIVKSAEEKAAKILADAEAKAKKLDPNAEPKKPGRPRGS